MALSMGSKEYRMWLVFGVVWEREMGVLERFEIVVAVAIGFVRNENPVVIGHGEPATVERPMVELTECETVFDDVSAVLSLRIDVCRLYFDRSSE